MATRREALPPEGFNDSLALLERRLRDREFAYLAAAIAALSCDHPTGAPLVL